MCALFTQGFISGFALIPPWAMKRIVPTALIIRLNFDAVALTIARHFKGIQGFNYFVYR